jgi:hypothetical protein
MFGLENSRSIATGRLKYLLKLFNVVTQSRPCFSVSFFFLTCYTIVIFNAVYQPVLLPAVEQGNRKIVFYGSVEGSAFTQFR